MSGANFLKNFVKKRKRWCFYARYYGMRRRRLLKLGATYHVTMRANRKEMIMRDVAVKNLYIQVVHLAKQRYVFRIEQFCIMDNHIHLIIKPQDSSNLSSIMQWINSVFAMRYNKMFSLTGHVWGERFRSFILNSLRDFMHAFEYIDQNPVRAHMVACSKHWEFGGYSHARRGCYSVLDPPGLLRKQLYPDFMPLLIGVFAGA